MLDLFWNLNLTLNRSVGLFVMAGLNRSFGGRVVAFCPRQTTESRDNFDFVQPGASGIPPSTLVLNQAVGPPAQLWQKLCRKPRKLARRIEGAKNSKFDPQRQDHIQIGRPHPCRRKLDQHRTPENQPEHRAIYPLLSVPESATKLPRAAWIRSFPHQSRRRAVTGQVAGFF